MGVVAILGGQIWLVIRFDREVKVQVEVLSGTVSTQFKAHCSDSPSDNPSGRPSDRPSGRLSDGP